jgi:hypothetical protein
MLPTACAALLALAPLAPAAPTAPGPLPAVAPPTFPADQKGLDALASRLVDEWMAKVVKADPAALEAAMMPCFQRVGFAGVNDRAAEIKAIASLGVKAPKVSDVIATRAGDALVVTCLVTANEMHGGAKLPDEATPRLGVWLPGTDGWKLAAWATLLQPSPRPAPAAPGFAGDAALNAEGAAFLAKFLGAQHRKELDAFDAMLDESLQVVNFKGQKRKADIVKGAKSATTGAPTIAEARATRCGDLTVVTCTLSMSQEVGWSTLPADPAPFLLVHRGTGDAAKVVAIANTNRPK